MRGRAEVQLRLAVKKRLSREPAGGLVRAIRRTGGARTAAPGFVVPYGGRRDDGLVTKLYE